MTLAQSMHSSDMMSQTIGTMIPNAEREYKRILVLLDGPGAAERAISAAAKLATPEETEIILVIAKQPGAEGFVNAKVNSLRFQQFAARGYTINTSIANLPNWLVASEHADAIIVPQHSAGWFGRLFGQNIAAKLRATTDADVLEVAI